MEKPYHYGCRYESGETLEETIRLYELEIKERSKHLKSLETCFPDYPTIPDTRGTIKHFNRIVKWLKELKQLRGDQNASDHN